MHGYTLRFLETVFHAASLNFACLILKISLRAWMAWQRQIPLGMEGKAENMINRTPAKHRDTFRLLKNSGDGEIRTHYLLPDQLSQST